MTVVMTVDLETQERNYQFFNKGAGVLKMTHEETKLLTIALDAMEHVSYFFRVVCYQIINITCV